MNKILVFLLSLTLFSSCSILRRDLEEQDGISPQNHAEAEGESESETGTEPQVAASVDSEVASLNTKIAALETKVDVLTSNLERLQMQKTQPVIEARPLTSPEPSMAAPVEYSESTGATSTVSAAPVRPSNQSTAVKAQSAKSESSAERDFRTGMELFQNGRNLEAASNFAIFTKKYPQHLLASHALYWAGEAAARAQQWPLAIDNWTELENRHPRSAYLPETLAGLARAYEKQGDSAKSAAYRQSLLQSFPKAPVVLTMNPEPRQVASQSVAKESVTAPLFEESDESSSETE